MTVYIITLLYQDFSLGGDEWKQGDWLINDINVEVRRGILGSVILRFSEATSLDPVLVVTSLQGILLVLSVVFLSLAIERFRCRGTLWLLVLSPGFFINFWSVDIKGGLRKELIIYLAFSALLYAVTFEKLSKTLLFLSTLIFGVAVVSHEGNVFFAPFFCFCYILMFQNKKIGKPCLTILLASTLAFCLVSIAIALRFSNVESYMLVCQPLLDAGMRIELCNGAIKALELSLGDFTKATFWMFFSPRLLSFVLMYSLASVSVLAIGFYLFDRKKMSKSYFFSALFFLPLYVVAVDWGRWLSFHITAVTFTMLIVLTLKEAKTGETSELPRGPFIALMVFSVVWNCTHFVSAEWGGILFKALSGVFNFIL